MTSAYPSDNVNRLMDMPNQDKRLQLLRSAPMDSWIALSEDESRIVAVGATYEEVVKNSESAGFADPLLLKIPKVWMPISV